MESAAKTTGIPEIGYRHKKALLCSWSSASIETPPSPKSLEVKCSLKQPILTIK